MTPPWLRACVLTSYGGDFNCCLSPNDADGGKYKPKVKSVAEIQSIIEDFDLCDIWRIRNPEIKQYTWRTFSPLQRRLGYILLSDSLQFLTSSVKIKHSVQTDHSSVILELHSNGKSKQGPSHWKSNTSLTNNTDYNNQLKFLIEECISTFEKKENPCQLWEYVKYKVRQFTIRFSKDLDAKRKAKLANLEREIQVG